MNNCLIEPVCQVPFWTYTVSTNTINYSKAFINNIYKINSNKLDDLLILLNRSDREELNKCIKRIVEFKDNQNEIVFSFNRGEEKVIVECKLKVLKKNEKNDVELISGVCKDITLLKWREENYNTILFRYRKLINHLAAGIVLEDENGKVFFANKKFCEYFKPELSPYDLLGANYLELFDHQNYGTLFTLYKEKQLEQKDIFRERIVINDEIQLEIEIVPLVEDTEMKGHLWLFKDITKFLQNEEKFRRKLEFEEMVLKIAAKFIDIEWRNIDEAVNTSIGEIGDYIKADRSYVLLFEGGTNVMNKTNEWVKKGVNRVANDTGINIETMPWLMNRVYKSETTYLPDINDLPASASIEKEIFESINIKSLVIIPLIFQKGTIGYLAFESVTKHRHWDEESIRLLNIASIVISNAVRRKINEEALFRGEERYKLISKLTSNYAFSFELSKNGSEKLLWMTGSFKDTTGYMLEEFKGFSALESIVFLDDLQYFREQREKIHNEKSIVSEYRILTKDNKIKWLEEYAIIEKEEDYYRIFVAVKDISKRKENEEKLANDRNLLRTIIDNIPDPIYVKDLTGKKVLVNNAEMQILGAKSMDEVLSHSEDEYYPPEVVEKTNVEDSFVFNSGEPLINKEGFVITRSGETKWFIGNKIPQRDRNGRIVGLVGISYNITERKKAEEEIKKSLQKEKELNELKTELLVKVSHEFRTPLAALLSSSELLEQYWTKLQEEQRKQHLSKIKKSVKNLIDILSNITEINKLESAKTAINIVDIKPVDLVEEIVEEIKIAIDKIPIITIKNSIRETIKTDLNILKHILSNLISNAVKYTPTEKNVVIDLDSDSKNLYIKVIDEGIGIPENEIKTIYEPFIRCTNAVDYKGTGLGLSILKSSVDTLNGNIELTSKLNEGTTFYITLPINDEL